MSSHQMASIEEFCTDILILNRGKTVLKGNLKEIKESYPANKIEINVNRPIERQIKEFGLEVEIEKNNEYIVKIQSEEIAHKLLKSIVDEGIEVYKFEIKKPSLHDIFIEKVGE